MRVLIATDKFKGSLTAPQAAEAIARGLGSQHEAILCPFSDGGEGFTETMSAALGARWIDLKSIDALGREIDCRYALTPDRLAIMEMSEASGFERIAEKERDILRSHTAGTGLLMRHAIEVSRAQKILIGIGGSATNDAGTGMATALGYQFLDSQNQPLKTLPADLHHLHRIDRSNLISLPPVEVACDVENPLLGKNGATAIYGPQKGADPNDQEILENNLAHLVKITGTAQLAHTPGAGAAGGLGFGLLHFARATLRPGFDLVADSIDLDEKIKAADLVITGEGSLDAQSLSGKGPVGIARRCQQLHTPVYAVGGHITPEVTTSGLFNAHASLTDLGLPLAELMSNAADLLTKISHNLAAKF